MIRIGNLIISFGSIDETFSSLGEVVKTLFLNIYKTISNKKVDIPIEICEFSKIIHKVFGLGASRLELKIMIA